MSEYIEREALARVLDEYYDNAHEQTCIRKGNKEGNLWRGICGGVNYARNKVADAPAADVALVMHAEWIDEGNGCWRCSECREIFTFDAYGDIHPKYDCSCNYCPNCGAKMDGGKND